MSGAISNDTTISLIRNPGELYLNKFGGWAMITDALQPTVNVKVFLNVGVLPYFQLSDGEHVLNTLTTNQSNIDLSLWHRRLGHPSCDKLVKTLTEMGVSVKPKDVEDAYRLCITCSVSNAVKKSIPRKAKINPGIKKKEFNI